MPKALCVRQNVQTGFEAHTGSVNVFWNLLFSMSEASGPLRRTLTPYLVWNPSVLSLSHTYTYLHGEQRDSFIVLFTSRITNQPSKRLPLLWLRRLLLTSRNVIACSWRQMLAFRRNLLSHLQDRIKEVFSICSAKSQHLSTRKYGVTP
jgi:hypothetical protein